MEQLIRDALRVYGVTHARPKKRLTDVPVLEGHRWIGPPLEPGEAFGEMADERFDRATRRVDGFVDPIDEEGWE